MFAYSGSGAAISPFHSQKSWSPLGLGDSNKGSMLALLEAARLASGEDAQAPDSYCPEVEFTEGEGADTSQGGTHDTTGLLDSPMPSAPASPSPRKAMKKAKKNKGHRCPTKLIPGGPCVCCGVRLSPQWRRPLEDESVLCNACGIYYTRHKALPDRKAPAIASEPMKEGVEADEEDVDDVPVEIVCMIQQLALPPASRTCDNITMTPAATSPATSPATTCVIAAEEPTSNTCPCKAVEPKSEAAPGSVKASDGSGGSEGAGSRPVTRASSPSESSSFTPLAKKRPAAVEILSSASLKMSRSIDLRHQVPEMGPISREFVQPKAIVQPAPALSSSPRISGLVVEADDAAHSLPLIRISSLGPRVVSCVNPNMLLTGGNPNMLLASSTHNMLLAGGSPNMLLSGGPHSYNGMYLPHHISGYPYMHPQQQMANLLWATTMAAHGLPRQLSNDISNLVAHQLVAQQQAAQQQAAFQQAAQQQAALQQAAQQQAALQQAAQQQNPMAAATTMVNGGGMMPSHMMPGPVMQHLAGGFYFVPSAANPNQANQGLPNA